jgi:predicted  nucleic acid-binding Zn-ribbon protein
MTHKCKRCGETLVKMLNVDKSENGGGKSLYVCPNIECSRVRDAFDYTHLEIYCTVEVKRQ